MHYCKKRGRTQCCFQNEECEENWIEINDKVNVNVFKNQNMQNFCVQMANRSRMFLTNTEQFLASWVELGHDTCHRTQGYDVTPCHQDCQQKEKSGFAQQCKKDGGLFKCCIR